jgi:hypothetical protein
LKTTFLLFGFIVIERGVILIVGHIVHQLRCGGALRLLLAPSSFIITPNLTAAGGFLPHVVEAHNLIVRDGTDMLGDIAPLGPVFRDSLFERFDLFRAQVGFLQVFELVHLLQFHQSSLNIEAVSVEKL